MSVDAQVVVFPQPHAVELRTGTVPDPGPRQVLVRTRLSLVSAGTETTVLEQRFEEGTHWADWVRYPFRPGYACIGEVLATGPEVSGLRRGDRVALRAGHASHHLLDAPSCTPVPSGIGDDEAVWFALAKIAFVGVLRAGASLGSRVLVMGAGPIGQMATRWLSAAGAGDVVVTDLVPDRLALAAAGGATATLPGPLTDDASVHAVFDGARPEIVIDSTGNPGALATALRLVADQGTVVLLGDTGTPSRQHLTGDVIRRNLRIVGAHELWTDQEPEWEGDQRIHRLFFHLLDAGHFPLDGLITHRFPANQARTAYDLVTARSGETLGVVFTW